MKKFLKVFVLIVAIAVMQFFGSVNTAAAPVSAGTNGYRLSPVRTDLTISKGDSDDVTVYIQNASSGIENLQVIVDDFEAPTNESGYPALLLNGATAPDHSLKQFTTIPQSELTLQPNEQKAVSVNIAIPNSAASGGYYGAVRFAPVSIGSNGARNIDLSASIASLVLVTVPGNLDEKLSIAGFGVSQGSSTKTQTFFLNNKNLSAQIRFDNTGNIQEQPFGSFSLSKGSKKLGTFAVNGGEDPGNVLPDSIRLFSVQINKVGWFGKYKIEGNFGYGSKGQILSATSTFYVIPVLIIILIVLLILFILFLIFGLPRVIRAYNRRVITRASRRG
jgi:hypothetical protein